MEHNFRLKAVLIERYGSQCAAAPVLGISEWRLSRIIRGWNEPSQIERAALARVLGLKVVNSVLKLGPQRREKR